MEYPVWRKKAPTQQHQNFIKLHSLEQSLVDDGVKIKTTATTTASATITTISDNINMSTTAITTTSSIIPSLPASTITTPTTSSSPLPHGAEIKIPGVGVTPVAVSTTLPAAVAQLNQQGNDVKLIRVI